jgi:hypothetical protein
MIQAALVSQSIVPTPGGSHPTTKPMGRSRESGPDFRSKTLEKYQTIRSAAVPATEFDPKSNPCLLPEPFDKPVTSAI